MNSTPVAAGLGRVQRLCFLLALAFLGSACSDEPKTLTVRLITSLASGAEFRVVQTTVLNGDARNTAVVLGASEAATVPSSDYSHGADVATYELSPGSYRVRVRLLRYDGSMLVERVVAVSLSSHTIVPVHLTRDCVGVVCPNAGGSSELSTCLAGQCVDPRCGSSAREFCPALEFCASSTECGDTSACAEPECVEGLCVASPIVGACSSTEWCNPEQGEGCLPLVQPDPVYFPCDTVCFDESTPCRFGYWRCDAVTSPVCMELADRPAGFVCGVGRSCDLAGACVDDVVPTPAGVSVTPRTGLETNENGAGADFTVELDTAPTANVTVTFTSATPSEASVSPLSIEFTPDNWSLAQTVHVAGVDDSAEDGDQAFTILTTTGASDDADYSNLVLEDLTGVNRDDDMAGLVVTPTNGLVTTESGASTMFTIVLATQPSSDVTVALSSSDLSEGTVLPSSVVFTSLDWNVPHAVTITGVDDNELDGPIGYAVVTAPAASDDANYAGLDPADVSVTNLDDVTQLHYVKASNAESPDSYGISVALSGDGNTMAVGALNEASAANGINGDENDNSASGAGAVYVFVRSGVTWVQQAYIKASNTDAGDRFGYPLVLSRDGSTLAVASRYEDSAATGIGGSDVDDSASNSGAVYVFARTDSTWTQQAYVKASNTQTGDSFASAVGLSADGNTMAVGAPQEDGGATGVDGDQGDNSASNSGAVYLFDRALGVWTQIAYVKASNTGANDGFGSALAVSGDGLTLAVGAGGEASDARGVNGDQASNAAVYAGAVYVFIKSGMSWLQQAYIKASNSEANDQFGLSVSISSDGSTLAVGAYAEDSASTGVGAEESDNAASSAGAVYVFTRTLAEWDQQAYIKASTVDAGDVLGQQVSVSADGNVLIASAQFEDSNARIVGGDESDNSASGSGAAFMFARVGATWLQVAYVKAANADASDNFGTSLALSDDGRTIAISAPAESSNAVGVDGDASNNLSVAAGAVYMFAAD